MTNETEILSQYREALIDSMKKDLSKHQERIFGSGSLPEGIHGYYKALEQMTQEYLLESFLKEHSEWKECCREDESMMETLEDFIMEFKFWRMKQIKNLQLWTTNLLENLKTDYDTKISP